MRPYLPEIAGGVLFFILYLFTLQPGVLPGDAGEFQLVVPTLGVAHPPGYGLYIMLGKLFVSLVPIGEMAWRVNLFSAFTSTLTLVVVYRTVQAIAGQKAVLAGWLAMLMLGVSTTFWAQATTANIRSLTALFTALMLLMLVQYWQASVANDAAQQTRRLTWLALFTALGVLHHASLAFIAVVTVLGVLLLDPSILKQPKRWRWPLLAGLLPLLTLLYLPWRGGAGAVLASPALTTWDGFLDHVLARGFGSDMFYYAAWQDFVPRLPILQNVYEFQFGQVLLVLSGIGLLALCIRHWRLGVIMLLGVVVHSWVAITYRAPQTVEYLLPAYVILISAFGGWLSIGFAKLRGNQQLIARLAVYGIALFFLIGLARTNWRGYRYLAQDTSTQTYVSDLLANVPDGAPVFANWHWVTPLWYEQTVNGERKDLNVQYVVPQGESLAWNWADRVSTTPGGIITSYYPAEYAATGANLAPQGAGWQIAPDYSQREIAGAEQLALTFEQRWALTQLHVDLPQQNASIIAGYPLHVTLDWQALGEPEAIRFFVQLLGADGIVYAQDEVSYQAGPYPQGGHLVKRHTLSVSSYAPAGDYSLIVGAVRPDGTRLVVDETGADYSAVRKIRVQQPYRTPPFTQQRLRGHSGLYGIDIDRSQRDAMTVVIHCAINSDVTGLLRSTAGETPFTCVPAPISYTSVVLQLPADAQFGSILIDDVEVSIDNPPASRRHVTLGGLIRLENVATHVNGNSLTVDATWQATRPLTKDIVMRVDVVGANDAWRLQSDFIPAGGAIPTLKWLPGHTIHDYHQFELPAGASLEGARLELIAYDHFTNERLAINDPWLARDGIAIPVYLDQLEN